MSKRAAEHIMRSFMALFLFVMLSAGYDGEFLLDHLFTEWAGIAKCFVLFLVIWLAFGKLRTPCNSSSSV